MFDIGGGELLLILIFVLITFGPKKLPELAQSLGRGLREFKRAQREFTEQINSAIEIEQRKSARSNAGGYTENTISQRTPSRAAISEQLPEDNNMIPPPPTQTDEAQLGMFPEENR